MPAPRDRERSKKIRSVDDILRTYFAALQKQFKPPAQLLQEVEKMLEAEGPKAGAAPDATAP